MKIVVAQILSFIVVGNVKTSNVETFPKSVVFQVLEQIFSMWFYLGINLCWNMDVIGKHFNDSLFTLQKFFQQILDSNITSKQLS